MTKAIGNIEDIAHFQHVAEQCVVEMSDLRSDTIAEIGGYQQRITEEIERIRTLCHRIQAMLERLRYELEVLDP